MGGGEGRVDRDQLAGLGAVRVDETRDVGLLVEGDRAGHGGVELDGEEVRDEALVLDLPASRESGHEEVVERARAVVRVGDAEVVDVDADEERVKEAVDGLGHHEQARVGPELPEAEPLEEGEERALPAAAGLGHAVDGLVDTVDVGLAELVESAVAGRAVAVADLVLLERALQVGRDEVPAPEVEAVSGGVGGEDA